MSDGRIRSNPSEIWNYYSTLNTCSSQLDEALEKGGRTCENLRMRLESVSRELRTEAERLETERNRLLQEAAQEEDEGKKGGLLQKAAMLGILIKKQEEQQEKVSPFLRRLRDGMDEVVSAQKNCGNVFSRAKRILNNYLLLLEFHSSGAGGGKLPGG